MKKIIADPNIPFLEVFSGIGNINEIPGREWTGHLVRDADILLTRSVTRVDQALLENSKVQFVGTATSGFDHVDYGYLKRQGITFRYCPGSNANSVAEYVLSAILVSKLPEQTLMGMTAGIIGCGHVGSRVAELLGAVGVECVLNDPQLKEQTGDNCYRSLEDALKADIISLHTPLTFDGEHSTYQLISVKELQQINPRAILINAARGGVIDEAALLAKMKQCPTLKIVIDCWENEPTIDRSLLRKVSLATPHIAGYSYDGKIKATMMLYQAVCDFLKIEPDPQVKSDNVQHLLDFTSADLSPEESLKKMVLSAYDIQTDHEQMQPLLNLSIKESSDVFDQLRKNYSIRNEFDKFEIKITDKMSSMENKLKRLGFVIRVDRGKQ